MWFLKYGESVLQFSLVHFEPICFYCGLGKDPLADNDQIKELKAMYAIVYTVHTLLSVSKWWKVSSLQAPVDCGKKGRKNTTHINKIHGFINEIQILFLIFVEHPDQ